MKRAILVTMIVLVVSMSWLGAVSASSWENCQGEEGCFEEFPVNGDFDDAEQVFADACDDICGGDCSFSQALEETYDGHWSGWIFCEIEMPG